MQGLPYNMRDRSQTLSLDASTSYGPAIEEQRATEFARISGKVYVDHAGAALYSELQLSKVFQVIELSLGSCKLVKVKNAQTIHSTYTPFWRSKQALPHQYLFLSGKIPSRL